MFSSASRSPMTDCTASVFEVFFEVSRVRLSMFKKSVLPPVFS